MPNATPTHTFRRNRAARGFSLVEAVLAMAITGILLVGMGAALVASAKAADLGQGVSGSSVSAALAIQMIRDDLAMATKFTDRDRTSLAFTVPDRNGDGVDETIQYAWTGVRGAPLTRSYNASSPIAIVPACDDASFLFFVTPAPVTAVESQRTLVTNSAGLSSPNKIDVKNKNDLMAQLWIPTIAPGTAIQVSRISVGLRRGDRAATMRLRVFANDSNIPTAGRLLSTATLPSSTIASTSTFTFTEFTLPEPVLLRAGAGIWMVLDVPGHTAPGKVCEYAYAKASDFPAILGAMRYSDNAGSSWRSEADAINVFSVTGAPATVTVPADRLE